MKKNLTKIRNIFHEHKALCLMIIFYSLTMGLVACLRHYGFQTQTWDMGLFNQIFWNAVHGHGLVSSAEMPLNHLAIHASPFLYLLVPGYAVFQSPYFLLIAQTLAIAAGAWPLYFLAWKMLGNKNWGILFAAMYLLSASVQWVNFFDFHEIAFFLPLMLAAVYFAESEKWPLAGLFLLLAASTKEDAILLVAAYGLFLLIFLSAGQTHCDPLSTPISNVTGVRKNDGRQFSGQCLKHWNTRRLTGLITTMACLLYFVLSVKLIMPLLGGGLMRLDRYQQLGSGAAEIIKNSLGNPHLVLDTLSQAPKLVYDFLLLFPVAFLPLLYPPSWLLIIPGILENTLTNFPLQYDGHHQYNAILLPGIFIGTLWALRGLFKKYPDARLGASVVLIVVTTVNFLMASPVSPLSFPTSLFQQDERTQAFRKMTAAVPPGAVVAAHYRIVPHLANRQYIFMLGRENLKPDYVLADASDSFGFQSVDEFKKYLDGYLHSQEYSVKDFGPGYLMFSKK